LLERKSIAFSSSSSSDFPFPLPLPLGLPFPPFFDFFPEAAPLK